MAVSPTSTMRTAFVAETVYGTTPSTPAFKTLRLTDVSGGSKKKTVVSDELRADRNVSSEAMVAVETDLKYQFELSYGSFDDLFAAALKGTWTTNVLKNGLLSPSHTIEETIAIDGGNSISRYPGAVLDELSLSIKAAEKITGSFSFMCKSETLATATISGATYAAASVTEILNGANHVGALSIANLAAQPKLLSLDLNVKNNARRRQVVGDLYTLEPGLGAIDVTGRFSAYFESNELFQAVIDHEFGEISVNIGAVSGSKYTITIPKAQFLSGERQRGGRNSDVIVDVPFRGLYDSTAACSLQIDRAVV